MTRVRLTLLAAAAVLFVAACGDDSPDPGLTAPPPAAGFTRVIGNGFTIDMPAGWQQPSVDPVAYEQTATALRARNPLLADALDRARQSVGSDTRLFAFDPSDGSSVNLIVTDARDRSLETIVADAIFQLGRVGVNSVHQEPATVGRHPAVRLEFALPVSGSGGTLAVPETQYYVVRDDRLFILTLFGSAPALSVVAESLRIE